MQKVQFCNQEKISKIQEKLNMPYYDFACQVKHQRELKMSFKEHAELEKDSHGIYVECNVKYGDIDLPACPFRAYQQFDKNVGFPGFETARS